MATKELKKEITKTKQTTAKQTKGIVVGGNLPNSIKETQKRRIKRALTAVTTVLAAGTVCIAPVVIWYKKNEEYEITIESQTENFHAYSITLKRGATISNVKENLNVMEGHNLVGIYKDEACTIPYAADEKVTKDTAIFLKYEKLTYSVSLPTSKCFNIVYSDTLNIDEIEWGEAFNFRIDFTENYVLDDMIVKANGVELKSNANGWYQISFMEENTVITIDGVEIDLYSVGTIPSNVILKNANDEVLTSNARIRHGDVLTISYKTTNADFTMSEFKINNVAVKNNSEILVVGHLDITYSEFDNSIITTTAVEGGYVVSNYIGASSTYNIPTCVENVPVIAIAPETFAENMTLVEVTIPNTVTTIGEAAFAGCILMKNLTIPSSVTTIGKSAFASCLGLSNLTIESADIYKQLIGIDYNIAGGILGVEMPAFEIKVSKDIVDNNANELLNSEMYLRFEGETHYTYIIAIPDGSTTFTSTTTLNGVTYIGTEANPYHTAVTLGDGMLSTLVLHENTVAVYMAAFRCSLNLTSVTIPKNVTAIGEGAFAYCLGLSSITVESPTIYAQLTDFDYACAGGILGVDMPVKEVNVSKDIVENNTNELLNSEGYLKFEGDTHYSYIFAQMLDPSVEYAQLVSYGGVTYLGTEGNAFYTAFYLEDRTLSSVALHEGTENIGLGAFMYCLNLNEITIPSSVTSIGEGAFVYCMGLKNVEIEPNSQLTTIGGSAFTYCLNLTEITIPSKVTSVAEYAFDECTNLTHITIESAEIYTQLTGTSSRYVGGILSNAREIKVLKEIVENNSNTYLSNGSYLQFENKNYYIYVLERYIDDAESVKLVTYNGVKYAGTEENPYLIAMYLEDKTASEIILHENTVTIWNHAFADCNNIISVTIPDSIISIGANAFQNCTNLTNIIIPNSVTNIGDYAFDGCNSLITVEFEEDCKLTNIGNYVFSDCTSLTNITIPDSVTSIGNSAFRYCTSLTNIIIPSSVTSIGSYAFSNCTKLSEITIESADIYTRLTSTSTSYAGGILANALEIKVLKSIVDSNKNVFMNEDYNYAKLENENYYIYVSLDLLDNYSTYERFVSYNGIRYLGTEENPYYMAFNVEDKTTSSVSLHKDTISIGYKAFEGCVNLTNITLPSGVTNIRDYAFNGCTSLTEVTIPSKVTLIGNYSFQNCTNLNSVEIETGDLWAIGNYAFYGCKGLKNVTIPKNVTMIAIYAFYGCTSLTSVQFEEGSQLETIGQYAFQNCSSLTSITIPSNVTTIVSSVFSGCTSLINITIESSTIYTQLTSTSTSCAGGILANAIEIHVLKDIVDNNTNTYLNDETKFIKFESDEYYIYLPAANLDTTETYSQIVSYNGVTYLGTETNPCHSVLYVEDKTVSIVNLHNDTVVIGNKAFSDCKNLITLTIPSGVTSIGNYAFSHCERLTNIDIPNSVTMIGDYAFYYCSSLENVIMPDGLTCIGKYTFSVCGSLKSVTIPNTVTTIKASAFSGCVGLTGVMIPTGVTTIENYAFSGCTGLTDIIIPSSVSNIGNYAFQNCTGLTIVTIDSATIYKALTSTSSAGGCASMAVEIKVLKDIVDNNTNTYLNGDTYAKFENEIHYIYVPTARLDSSVNYTQLVSYNGITYAGTDENPYYTALYLEDKNITSVVVLHEDTISIAYKAFADCNNLTSITIPNGVISIGSNAFQNCTALTSVTIPSSITSIGTYAFSGCSGLTSVNISDGVISIGNNAFEKCIGLTSVIIPSSVTSISVSLFRECINLSRVVIPDGVTSIGKAAFYNCISLTTIDLPISLVTLGESAFSACEGLVKITIPNSVTSIGGYAFSGCSSLVEITLSSKLTQIQERMFLNCKNLKNVIIPSGVTSIGYHAFASSGITNIIIPSKLSSIAAYAFNGCGDLTQVTIQSVSIYKALKSAGACSNLIANAKEIVVSKSIVDSNTNTYLNDKTLYTKTLYDNGTEDVSDDYYIFKKI